MTQYFDPLKPMQYVARLIQWAGIALNLGILLGHAWNRQWTQAEIAVALTVAMVSVVVATDRYSQLLEQRADTSRAEGRAHAAMETSINRATARMSAVFGADDVDVRPH